MYLLKPLALYMYIGLYILAKGHLLNKDSRSWS